MPLPRRRFRSLCRHLSREEFLEFVASLEETRGRTVDRRDGGVRVRTREGSRRVAVRSPGEYDGVPSDADRVVVAGTVDADDHRIRGIDDLHRQLCYALDRQDARALVADQFDRDPSTLSGPDPETWDDADGTRRLLGSVPTSTVALALLGCVVVAGAVLAVGVLGLSASPGGDSGSGARGEVSSVRVPPVGRTPVGETHASAPDYPPGVSRNGTLDARVLSRAHRVYLDERPYTLVVRYREYTDGTLTGRYTERIRVEDDDHYRSRVTEAGEFVRPPSRIASADTYANGSIKYVHEDGEIRTTAVLDREPFLLRVRWYLAWHFRAETSGVERTGRGYRITVTDETYATTSNVTGTALVTEDGLVRSFRRTYTYRNGSVRAVLVFRTKKVGETTVQRPDWLPE